MQTLYRLLFSALLFAGIARAKASHHRLVEELPTAYDAAGRVSGIDGFVHGVDYEARGLPATVTYGSGLQVANHYDARMRLTRATVGAAGGPSLQDLAYRYDAASQLLGLDDGVPVDGSPSFRADYTYDGLGRVTRASLDERRPTAEVQQFAYDAASRLLAKTSSNTGSKAHVGTYRYGEGAGPHAVTSAGSEAIAYDAGGFMSERRSAGSSTWAYAWDGRGRLSAVSRDAAVVQTSSYDAAGMRVVKREGASTTLYLAPDFEVRDGLATTYVKAGTAAIARVEEPAFATTFFPDVAPLGAGTSAAPAPDGVITAADAWVVQAAKAGLVDLPPPEAAKAKTADVDKMLASAALRILGADATHTTYVSHDYLGSPSLETGVTGAVVARRWHGPYGEARGATGAWNEPRGFTGKERDGATGLADHGARYLDTRLGRWTAPDPLAVRELGGAELDVYGYVDGRVTAATDPTGYDGVELRARQRELAAYTAEERKEVTAVQARVLETAAVVVGGSVGCAAVPALCTNLGRIGTVAYLASSASPQEAAEKAVTVAGAELGAKAAGKVVQQVARATAGARVATLAAKRLATGADDAVFWSGLGRGGDVKAASWVAKNGGATLETTMEARGIKLPTWDPNNSSSVAAWKEASRDFAAGARGNVTVLQGDSLGVDCIWKDEFKALQSNPNVNSIRAINPETGAHDLLWSR